MVKTDPHVYMISQPQILTQSMFAYLRDVGGMKWWDRLGGVKAFQQVIPAAEGLIEFCGRLCYKSWEPGLNKNVTKIREDRGDYLLNILRSAHGSVLEHAYFSFALHDVSRVLTAELNRHRAGVAISEQSLRYVRLDQLRFRIPPLLAEETQEQMEALVNHCESELALMIEREIKPDDDFAQKKMITSALRRAVPMGISTDEVWTANVRTIRHVIEMRSALGAEEEIRIVANQIGYLMFKSCPLLFGDYSTEDDGSWSTEYRKV